MSKASAEVRLNECVLSVTGEVDVASVVALRKQGETLISRSDRDLSVDLSGLDTAHSVILSMLLCWQRYAGALGLSLDFKGASDRLAALAALSNLDQQFAGFTEVSAAHAH
ncbi:NTP binding protein [Marinobacter nitratireducens]|uniref:NTP binding protein n=1 Tax=Marinobacter nitratireducens TaxID=1137280 RepID=A0A072NEW8_9GAMM|nr:STAS domain-containing protein [Marinobacter nitratireducens]KEF31600.1 NTP binding protein [Marinobacter nitratireducens]